MRSSLVACFLFLLSTSALADETASGGLTLRWPSEGQRNWGSVFRDGFATPLSTHDHTGSGKGLKIGAAALDANAVTGASLRLDNAQWLRARNAANSADTNLLRLDSSDVLRFNSAGANTRADLGLAIGTNVQAFDSDLTTLGALGSGARTALGLGSGDSPTFTGLSISQMNTDVAFFGNGFVRQTTSDGSDNACVTIGGGGAIGTGRGAGAQVCGNEASSPGYAVVTSGVVSGSILDLVNPTNGPIRFYTDNAKRLTLDSTGAIQYNATNGLLITAETSDGSDNSLVAMGGGGAIDITRGAYFVAYGNEGGNAGQAFVSGSEINIEPTSGGVIDLGGTATASTCTIAGYINVKINGTAKKLPYCN